MKFLASWAPSIIHESSESKMNYANKKCNHLNNSNLARCSVKLVNLLPNTHIVRWHHARIKIFIFNIQASQCSTHPHILT